MSRDHGVHQKRNYPPEQTLRWHSDVTTSVADSKGSCQRVLTQRTNCDRRSMNRDG